MSAMSALMTSVPSAFENCCDLLCPDQQCGDLLTSLSLGFLSFLGQGDLKTHPDPKPTCSKHVAMNAL